MAKTKPGIALARLAEHMARLAPTELAEAWDNVGLQIGDPRSRVRRVMTCLEVTAPTLSEARRRRADAIIAHHPLIFRPMSTLVDSDPAQKLAADLIRSGIALIAAHTNLDSASWGTNQALAEACGLSVTGPLRPKPHPEAADAGLGCLARPAEPIAARDLARKIKRRLGLRAVRLSGPATKKIRRVAICTGSGGSLLATAVERSADMLLTGEATYHHGIEAHQRGIALLEIGHFESEQIVAEPLAERLAAIEELSAAGVVVFAAKNDHQPFIVL